MCKNLEHRRRFVSFYLCAVNARYVRGGCVSTSDRATGAPTTTTTTIIVVAAAAAAAAAAASAVTGRRRRRRRRYQHFSHTVIMIDVQPSCTRSETIWRILNCRWTYRSEYKRFGVRVRSSELKVRKPTERHSATDGGGRSGRGSRPRGVRPRGQEGSTTPSRLFLSPGVYTACYDGRGGGGGGNDVGALKSYDAKTLGTRRRWRGQGCFATARRPRGRLRRS